MAIKEVKEKKKKKELTEEQYRKLEAPSPVGVLSYPHLFEKGVYQGNETNYNFQLLIKKDEDMSKVEGILHAAKVFEWGADESKWPEDFARAIQDGDEMDDEAYAGYWVIKATSNEQKPVFNREKDEIIDKKEIYGGAMCRAVLCASVYSIPRKKNNKVVYDYGEKFYYKLVQKVADGKRLGSGNKALELLDDLDDDSSNTVEQDDSDSNVSAW